MTSLAECFGKTKQKQNKNSEMDKRCLCEIPADPRFDVVEKLKGGWGGRMQIAVVSRCCGKRVEILREGWGVGVGSRGGDSQRREAGTPAAIQG